MGQISKEGAGCFWTIWGIVGVFGGIRLIIEPDANLGGWSIIAGLLIIALSILFIKYAGRAMWKS